MVDAVTVDWGSLVVTVGGGLLLFWLGAGLIAVIQHRRSIKADVSGKKETARAEYIADLQATVAIRTAERDYEREEKEAERVRRINAERAERTLVDYVHDLRFWAESQGCTDPPDWPPGLRR